MAHTLERLKSGDLELSVDAPDDPANVPRVMVFWRANPLGSNVKGHEYFLKYLLGTESSFLGEEARQPETIRTTPEPDSPEGVGGGKLDLMVTSEIRMSTTCVYSDIVLPAAHWDEYHDLSLDGHASVHPSLQSGDRPRVGSPDQLGFSSRPSPRSSPNWRASISASARTWWRRRSCTTPPAR